MASPLPDFCELYQRFQNQLMFFFEICYVAIKDTLESDGTLRKFKAEMRTKIMNILNGEAAVEKPHLSNETLLLNELIREYLSWNGYKYAKSVFIQESGLNTEALSRSQLLEELGVCDTEESSKFSVLHGIIAAFKEDIKKDAEVDFNVDLSDN